MLFVFKLTGDWCGEEGMNQADMNVCWLFCQCKSSLG